MMKQQIIHLKFHSVQNNNMAKTSCEFNTSEQSTKAWFRTKGLIDTFNRILNLNEFRKQNTKWSNYARLKFGTTGNLFLETYGGKKAIPNREVFDKIERRRQEELETTKNIGEEGVSELFESNPELANQVYEALGFEIPTTKLQGKQFEYGEPRFFDVVEELTSGERASLPSSILINKLLKGEYLPKIKESQIILGLSEAGIWRPNIKKIEASGENKSTLAKKIGHELLHSVTNNIILSYQNLKGTVDFTDKYYKDFIKQGYIKPVDLSKSQIEALDNLVRIRNKVISYVEQNKDKIQKQDRGFGTYDYFIRTNYTESETDLHEFISEVFTNPELINILKEIPTEGKKSNLFKDFVDAIAKILGFTNTSILEDIIAYSEEAFFTQPQITLQQKQQAQQLYSQYLESLNKSNTNPILKGNQEAVITPNDKIVFGHPTIGKSFLKNQGEDKFISLDDDYATEINNKVKEIADKYNITTYQVKDGGTQKWNNDYNQMMQEMFNVAKQRAVSEGKTLFTSNTNLLRNNAESFDKVINLTYKEFERRIQERGAKYDIKEWKSQINEAISKLPANKVINTNKYLSDLFTNTQQEQVKKFAELQERLNNKEFLEGAKNAFESSEELQNVAFEVLGFKTKTSENEITRGIKEILPFKVIGNYSNIEEGLTGRRQYSTTIDGNNYVFDISTYSYENEDGTFQSYYDIDFTVNGSEDIIGTGFFDKSEKAKQIIQAIISQNYGNDTIRINVEESKKGKQRLLLYKRLMNQLGYNPSDEMEYALFYDIKTDKVNLIPQQKQDASNAYTDYIARVSLGIIKNPSSGGYNYNSKVKDIVYHGSNIKFEKFNKSNLPDSGIYFDKNKITAYGYGNVLISAILNSSGYYYGGNLNRVNSKQIRENGETGLTNGSGNIVFEPEQIHILGSKQDVEGFKEFVAKYDAELVALKPIPRIVGFDEALPIVNLFTFYNSEKQIKYADLKNVKKGQIYDMILNNSPKELHEYIKWLKVITPNSDALEIKIEKLGSNRYGKMAGEYDGLSNLITIDTSLQEKDLGYILIHELTHAATHRNINYKLYPEYRITADQAAKLDKAIKELDYIRRMILGLNPNNKDVYGLTDIDEFVSELFSNIDFQKGLAKVYIKDSNYFNKIAEVIKKILGIENKSSALDVAFNASFRLFGDVRTNDARLFVRSQEATSNTTLTANQVIAVEKYSKALGIKYNVPVHTVYSDVEKAGWIENGAVYINLSRVKADTPIHEFGHIFVAIIKKENPELYRTLKQELLSSKEGIQVLREVRSKTLYQGGSNEGQIEEAIVELIGRKGVKYIGENKKLMALVTDFFTWISNTIKEFLGFRVDRLTNIKDIAKRISLGEDVDLSSEVIGLDYSQSSQIPFSEDLATTDTSIFYENADKSKVTLRASFMEVLLSPFRKAGAKELSYEERAADIFRRNNIPLDGVYEHKINNRVYGTLTLQEYADELRMRENRARLEGKAVHKYFQFLTTKIEAYKTEAESLAAQAGMDLDALYAFVGLYDLAQNRLNKKQTDTTYVEKTLTMDIPEFEIEDNTGAKVKVTGISGTMDEMIDHGDNVFTIVDYKTGAFDTLGLNVNHLMKYSKKAGVNWKFDSYHKNMLKTALYAVLLKSKVPQARFRNVYMAQVNEDEGFDLKNVELEPALKILSLYFKENHNAFWTQNQELFNPRTIKESYVNKKVLEAKVTNPSITKGEVISTYKEELLAELRQVAAFRAMLKKIEKLDSDQTKKLADTETRYKALVGQLAEIDLGFDPISLGTRQGLDIISAKITNLYHKSNPLIEYFRPMFYHGKNRARQEGFKLEREHNKYIVELEKEFYKNNKKKFIGANYEEFYEFLWDMNEDREIWLTTYKSNKWSELTQAQRNYADYYRWTMRYHMFLTMRPEMGVKFIQDELADRSDLTAEQISMLKSQITELEKQPKWNKFIQSKFPKFEYFEGWTPRVIKTAEESANFKQYWKNALDSTLLSNDEDEKVLHSNNEELSLTGLPLRYFGKKNESALNHKQLYTFNGELTLAYFVQSMLNKQYLDDVYNIGVGIDLYWRNQDEKGQDEKGLNKNNISFLQNVLKSLILQQKMDDFQGRTVGIPILNEEGKIEQRRIHVDTLIKFLRVTFAVPALALNILGAATTGTAQIIRLITQAGTGSIYKHTTGKDADLSTRDAAAAVAPLASWIKDSMLNFKGNGKLAKNKLHLFLQYTGFLPAGYENNPSSARRLKTTQGFVLGKKIDNELLLSLYSKVDNLIYSAYLYGQLKNIKWTDKNGKKWNMWEAYEVRDGEMVYIGGERGIDANSGKVITELTSEELVKIKAFSSRDLGAYREEEKNALESSAIGLFYMTFKRWMPSIVQRAFMPEFQDATLGKWVNSGGAIDPETGLPVMTWLKEHNQGFIRTLLKSIAIAALFLKDRKQAKADFNNLSEAQKQNIIFALAKLSMYAGLMMAVSAMFGDADADDDNKIKQAAIRVARDSSFEFVVFDFEGWGRTLTSVPSFEKAWEFTGGSMNVLFNGVIPDILPGFEPSVVQSGPHEGWYKGTTQVLRNTKFLSTGYSLWQMDNSWTDLEADIARLN
jgi:hypothetical protein